MFWGAYMLKCIQHVSMLSMLCSHHEAHMFAQIYAFQ